MLLNDGHGHFTQLANAMPAEAVRHQRRRDRHQERGLQSRRQAGSRARREAPQSATTGRWLQILINNGDGTFSDETAQRLPQADNTLTVVLRRGRWSTSTATAISTSSGAFRFSAAQTISSRVADANGVFTPVSLVPDGLDAVFSFVDVNGNGHRDFLSPTRTGSRSCPTAGAVLPPGIPQDVRARSLPDRVRLTWPYVWGAHELPGVAILERRDAPARRSARRLDVTYDDLGATATPMYYRVRAVNSAATSAASAPVGERPRRAADRRRDGRNSRRPVRRDVERAVNPNGSQHDGVLRLRLHDQLRQSGDRVAGTGLGDIAGGSERAVTGLSCNSTYHFRVTATNAGGNDRRGHDVHDERRARRRRCARTAPGWTSRGIRPATSTTSSTSWSPPACRTSAWRSGGTCSSPRTTSGTSASHDQIVAQAASAGD